MGWQGALLSLFVPEPIYIQTLVVSGLYYSEASMKRALWERLDYNRVCQVLSKHHCPYRLHRPVILHSTKVFPFSKDTPGKPSGAGLVLRRSGSAISWCSGVVHKPFQAIAKGGFLMGATKKSHPRKTQVEVARLNLFELFQKVLNAVPVQSHLSRNIKANVNNNTSNTYLSYKKVSVPYHETWLHLKSSLFNGWVSHDRSYDMFMGTDS